MSLFFLRKPWGVLPGPPVPAGDGPDTAFHDRGRSLIAALVIFLAVCPSRAADHTVTYNDNVNTHLIPCYGWTCGCSPTASAMVLGYWDNLGKMGGSSVGKYLRWGNLIQYYLDEPALETYLGSDGVHYQWQNTILSRPRLIQELAERMGTTGEEGSTFRSNIAGAINSLTATRGYGNQWAASLSDNLGTKDWLWDDLRKEIDNNRPCVWSTSSLTNGHSTCAWGYTDDHYVILYNTWNTAREDWYYAWYLGDSDDPVLSTGINTVTPRAGSVSDDLVWRYPDGGEIVSLSSSVTLWWDQFGTDITNVDIDYSLDGGLSWSAVASSQSSLPGLNYHAWTTPPAVASVRARVRARGYRDAGRSAAVAADGSKLNFTTTTLALSPPSPPAGRTYVIPPTATLTPTRTHTPTPTITLSSTRTLTPTVTPTLVAGQYVYPQPARDIVQFVFSNADAERVEVSLYNLRGVSVAREGVDTVAGGRHVVSVRTAGFAPGAYFYVLRASRSGLIGKGKLLVARP